MKKLLFMALAIGLLSGNFASADTLIGAGIGAGNGDFNYEGGAVGIPATVTVTEVIPRDRAFVSVGNSPGQGIDVDGWSFLRVAYSGANSAFGLDGHFGFDDAAFEPNNTGSGQAFMNGNANSIIDIFADTIAASGGAGDIFDLAYLGGSDSAGGIFDVTLTLDAGLGTEQVSTFATQTLAGTLRTGANDVAEQYISTGAYSTVDVAFTLGNAAGSTRALVDDVRLERTIVAVPEPTSLAFIGLAGMGLFVRRRK